MRIFLILTALLMTILFGVCYAQPATQLNTLHSFNNVFCQAQANPNMSEQVFIVSANLFSRDEMINCPTLGNFTLKKMNDQSDPGHLLFSVDATDKTKNTFDCDAKADIGMKYIGLNCFPTSKETATHKNPS